MITIKYNAIIKRNGKVIVTDDKYIQRMTFENAMRDLKEVIRVYNNQLMSLQCMIYPNNVNND